MSAPPLPEVFGNYALGDFVEVVSPEAISWLPQTAGWRWLGLLVLLAILYRGAKILRRWYRNRYRREATARVKRLLAEQHRHTGAGEINRLLKLTALAAFPRKEVASLCGPDWVEFLNRQCPRPAFSAQQAELLGAASYRLDPLDAGARRDLLAASLVWIREHRDPRGD